MSGIVREERGAALITVLLFMALTFILITSMLTVTGNEVVISSLQRDGIRAMDLGQAGMQEAIRRMEEGRKFTPSFTGSLQSAVPGSSINVTVVRRVAGVNSAIQEITATSGIGRASRRLSTLVLQFGIALPPNILFGDSVEEFGQSNVSSGDIYSRTFTQFREGEYTSSARLTYAGWRISKCVDPEKAPVDACKPVEIPAKVPPCYTHAQCVAMGFSNWYPGTRVGEAENTTLGVDITNQTAKCPAGGGGTLPPDLVPAGAIASDGTPIGGQPLYGFDRDDLTWDGTVIPAQAVTSLLPCGLPYKWVSRTFPQEKVTEPVVTRWFKTIVFDQWFKNYWTFNQSQMMPVKSGSLTTYPEFGAIPPRPEISAENYDQLREGGGVIDENSGIDYGCNSPQMVCPGGIDRPILLWLKGGNWTVTGNVFGHGTIVVDGNLTISGNFEYWGTIVVEGDATVILGAGNVKIHGGIVSKTKVGLGGNTLVEGGVNVPNVVTGRTEVVGKAWWER